MVGLDKFKEAFDAFTDNYVIIGGTACEIVMEGTVVSSYDLVAPEFIGSNITGAFTSELKRLIATSTIDYRIYGHSHRNIDAIIGPHIALVTSLATYLLMKNWGPCECSLKY